MRNNYFIESVLVRNRKFHRLALHEERMKRTAKAVFQKEIAFDLSAIPIPESLTTGTVKCRILYGEQIESVEFQPYRFKSIETLAFIHDDTIEYPYKSADRSSINRLLQKAGTDEIVIVKNGRLTDTSISNIVLESDRGFYTPSGFLLSGTKRSFLLHQGLIREQDISINDLPYYHTLHLINAMIDLGELTFPTKLITGL